MMSKTWLVTGGSRGLGRHIAEAVLAAGDNLVATARDPGRLSDLQDRYDDHICIATLDVTDALAARTAVQAATKAFGRLDVLVNNAGFGHVAPFEQATEEDFRAQIDTNFYGVVNLTRAALPVMRRQRSGHVINISSVGGRKCLPVRQVGGRRPHRSAGAGGCTAGHDRSTSCKPCGSLSHPQIRPAWPPGRCSRSADIPTIGRS
jgi:NAD(P)-dependent dehydrogenase (short-subunit alcohol dehydrogenase family)